MNTMIGFDAVGNSMTPRAVCIEILRPEGHKLMQFPLNAMGGVVTWPMWIRPEDYPVFHDRTVPVVRAHPDLPSLADVRWCLELSTPDGPMALSSEWEGLKSLEVT